MTGIVAGAMVAAGVPIALAGTHEPAATGTGRPGLLTTLDWENAADRTLPPTGWHKQYCCDKSLKVVTGPARDGEHAAQFTLDRGDPDVSSSTRSELSQPDQQAAGLERWYGFSIALATDWSPDRSSEIVSQWHQQSNNGSPPLALLTNNGHWKIDFRGEMIDLGAYRTGGWTDWVFHVAWRTDTSGVLEVWRDGDRVVSRTGRTHDDSAHSPYFKFGIYKWDWDGRPKPSDTSHRSMVYDALRIGDQRAGYASVAPGATVPQTPAPTATTAAPPPASDAGYTVVPATQKVMRNATSVAGTRTATLAGARNEFVSFQVVLAGGQERVTVAPGRPLTGTGGTIPNANVTLYREDYLTTRQASAGGRAVGAWPDALIPAVDRLYGQRRNAFPVDVPRGQNRVVFADVLVPRDQAAGGYDGSLTVTGSRGRAEVPIHLDVRGFTLPSTSSLRSLWSIGWSAGCDALYGSCDAWSSAANLQRAWRTNADFARLALDDRMTIANAQFQPPTAGAQRAAFDTYLLPLIKGTANTQLPGARLTTVAVDTRHLPDWKTVAEAGSFAGRAVTYDAHNCDEPGDRAAKWSACRNAVTGYKRTWPGLPNVMTADLADADRYDPQHAITDVITPVVDHLDESSGDQPAAYRAFTAKPGKEMWLYTSCDVSGCGGANERDAKFAQPWLDYTIDTQAAQNRAMGWLAYRYRASGELYYSTTQQLATAWTDQWGFGGNGDGTLFYPGTTSRIGGTTPIPLESLRMKMIRNGYQDYEYLRLADKAGHAAEARSVAGTLYPSTHAAAPAAAAIDTARAKLAALIGGSAPAPALTYDLTRAGSAITLKGADNTMTARLSRDDRNLHLTATVTDAAVLPSGAGRDGEVWNGDGIELMIDRNTTRPALVDPDDYHLLVSATNALTDERGSAAGWDRSWNAGATSQVSRTSTGYTVELTVPWSAIGGVPRTGSSFGLDLANNDTDSDQAAKPVSYDWAGLTRFAQPALWGTARVR
ncbi:heparin lyase I family protein [Actinoplanes sp. NPDC049681]|uniref:heparin lyase I family protein n=1 Tax=Actinoplanes sp. NPDC049681 TaxID=3363905 RepID=UPI0037B84EF9